MGQVGSVDAQNDQKVDKYTLNGNKSSHVKDRIDLLIETYLTDPMVDGDSSEVSSTDDKRKSSAFAALTSRRLPPDAQVSQSAKGLNDKISAMIVSDSRGEDDPTSGMKPERPAQPPRSHIKLKALIDRVLETSISTDVLNMDDEKRYMASESLFKNIDSQSPGKLRPWPLQDVKQNVMPATAGSDLLDKSRTHENSARKENTTANDNSTSSTTVVEPKVYDVSDIIDKVIQQTAYVDDDTADKPKILSMFDQGEEQTMTGAVDSPKLNKCDPGRVQPKRPGERFEENSQKRCCSERGDERYHTQRHEGHAYHDRRTRERPPNESAPEAYAPPKRGAVAPYYKYTESGYGMNPEVYGRDYNPRTLSSSHHGEAHYPAVMSKTPDTPRHVKAHTHGGEYLYPPTYALPQRASPCNSPPPLLKIAPQASMVPTLLPNYPWIQPQHGYPGYPHALPRAPSPRLPHLYQPGIRSGIAPFTNVPLGYHAASPWQQLATPDPYHMPGVSHAQLPSPAIKQHLGVPHPKMPSYAYPVQDEYRIITVDYTGQKVEAPHPPHHLHPAPAHHAQQMRLNHDHLDLASTYQRPGLADTHHAVNEHPLSVTYEQHIRREYAREHQRERHPDFRNTRRAEPVGQDHRLSAYMRPKQLTPPKKDDLRESHMTMYKPTNPRHAAPVKPPATSPHVDLKPHTITHVVTDCRTQNPSDTKKKDDSPLDLSSRHVTAAPQISPTTAGRVQRIGETPSRLIEHEMMPYSRVSQAESVPLEDSQKLNVDSSAPLYVEQEVMTPSRVAKSEDGRGSRGCVVRSRSSQGNSPSSSSLTNSPALSDDINHRYASKPGRKSESFCNLIGDHSPTDILYLICQLCGQTYGSPYGFRRHFRNQHRCEPMPEHAHIQTISETKSARILPVAKNIDDSTMGEKLDLVGATSLCKPVKQEDFPCLKAEMVELRTEKSDLESDEPPVLHMENNAFCSQGERTNCTENCGERWLVCHECQQKFKLNDFGVYRRHCRTHEKLRNMKTKAQTDGSVSLCASPDHEYPSPRCHDSGVGGDEARGARDDLSRLSGSGSVKDVSGEEPGDIKTSASPSSSKTAPDAGVSHEAGVEYRHKKFGRLLKPADATYEPPEKRVKLSDVSNRRDMGESPPHGQPDARTEADTKKLAHSSSLVEVDSEKKAVEKASSKESLALRKSTGDKREARHNLPFVWDRVTRSKSGSSKP